MGEEGRGIQGDDVHGGETGGDELRRGIVYVGVGAWREGGVVERGVQ